MEWCARCQKTVATTNAHERYVDEKKNVVGEELIVCCRECGLELHKERK
jgi:RNase P subunit RPR2